MPKQYHANGAGGPFDAHDVRCALEKLGFELVADAEDEGEAQVYSHRDGGLVPLDPDMVNVYYGDRWFRNTAGSMTGRSVAGWTRRSAIEQRMLLLRSHLLTCRKLREDDEH